ncbi:toxin glutamine deamidase domain-containing protein [Micromonospora sonneratiae]|uniref:Toxin glutamine deamidase domain-containing protein n=1 Tax=Micromonospora sonneratiae TaxID=1184706 RepID=A0ABW3YT88_9ACTN
MIDQAIAVAKIGDVMGPEFEVHAANTLARTLPMDLDHARARLSPEDFARLEPNIRERPSGFYDPVSGVTFVNHEGVARSPITQSNARFPRPISAVAATVVHEGMHALQPNNKLLNDMLLAMPDRAEASRLRAQLTFEREFQAFTVQQQFLRGLTGNRSPDFGTDPRIPVTNRYRRLASYTPSELRDYVIRQYQLPGIPHDVLANLPNLTPDNVVAEARLAIMESTHPNPNERRPGGLVGPITRDIAQQHDLDIVGIRQKQSQLSFPGLRDQPGSGTLDYEAAITRAVDETAAVVDGTRLGHTRPDTDLEMERRRAADEAAESRPGRPERQVRPRLRYTIELPSAGYADGVRRTIEDLAARGYQPVRLVNGWTAGDVGGLVSRWRDPGTGREFQLRLDTPESRAAHDAVRELQDARRSGADPDRLRDLSDRRQDAVARVRMPEGVEGISLHPAAESLDSVQSTPAALATWNDEQLAHLPVLSGSQATQAVADFMASTRSGLEFTGDPQMRRFAEALHPEAGVVRIALHGLRNGQVVVGRYRMSAEDFARGLAELERRRRISLGGRRIKLISCYSASGDQSLAATVARILGREVTGVTERMWTYPDGTEVAASPDVHNGRVPTMPADGVERTFGPNGREISPAPAATTPAPTSQPAEAGGGSRAGPQMYQGSDGRLHVSGDRWDSHRTPDGRLHLDGDRPSTFREPGNYRLHHESDPPGTYRSEADSGLRSVETGMPVRDPQADRSRPARRRAIEGEPTTHHSRQQPDQVAQAARQAADARSAVDDYRSATLRPLMDELGVSRLSSVFGSTGSEGATDSEFAAVSRKNLRRTIELLQAMHADDPAMRARIQELAAVAAEHSRLVGVARVAEADVPRVAAAQLLTDRFGMTGDDVLVGGPEQRTRQGNEFTAGFDRANHRLVLVETGQVRRTRYQLQDGTFVERGTPEHVRDLLETSVRLQEQLRQSPEVLDELHRALARGELQVEFHRIEVEDDGGQVSITTRQADLSGLNLDGVADRLPPPSGAPDPALGRRLVESINRLAAVFDGPSGRHAGIARIRMLNEHTVEVQPNYGSPYQIDIGTATRHDDGTGALITLGHDGTNRVVFAANHLDALDTAALDRFVAQTLGHVQGELRALMGGRFAQLGGLPAGRLNDRNVLVNDPTPGRRLRPSRADIAALAEVDALARLHAAAAENSPQRVAIEAELQTFIESHALREGIPGADTRIRLARRFLSESTARLLDDQRQWWRAPDPVVAGTHHVLSSLVVRGMTIEPVSVEGRTIYRVTPDNWSGTGRLTFTFEVQSDSVQSDSEPSNQRGIEFRGGGRERHFILVVDPASFVGESGPDQDPTEAFVFREKLRGALADQVEMQHARPGEVPHRWQDNLVVLGPVIAELVASAVAATVLGVPQLVIRRGTVAVVTLVTQIPLTRYITRRKLERKHDRALAVLPDRNEIANGNLQRRIDATYDRAGELAVSVLGDRSAADRTVHPDPESTADSKAVSEEHAAPIRKAVGEAIGRIEQELDSKPIEFLKKIRMPREGGDTYKLVLKGEAGTAVVHVEVAHTEDPKKIEVEYTDERITLRVPPELGAVTEEKLDTAVRKALTDVAKRQHDLVRHVTGLRTQLNRRSQGEWPNAATGPAGNRAGSGFGTMGTLASAAKALAQMIADRYSGVRSREVADRAERHDMNHSGRLTAGQRRNVGAQIHELTHTGQDLARAALNRLAGRPHTPTPTPPVAAPGVTTDSKSDTERTRLIDERKRAIEEAIQRLNARRETTLAESRSFRVGEQSDSMVFSTAESRRRLLPRRLRAQGNRSFFVGGDIDIQFDFDVVEDGTPVVPVTERLGPGRFRFTVNLNADPARVTDAVTHIVDNILFDRENSLPARRWAREDLVPALIQAGSGGVTALLTTITHGVLVTLTAFGQLIGRQMSRVYQVHSNDLDFIRSLSDVKNDNVTPQHLREQLEQQRQPIEELEQRAREIEEQLAADPRTAHDLARLRQRYGNLPPADQDVLPSVDQRVANLRHLGRGVQISRVADTEHTFRLVFRGASNRPENLTFEIRTGQAGAGAVVTAYRVDSDVTYTLRVDPTQTPEQIAEAVRTWAIQEMQHISGQPTGLPSPQGRLLTFARDASGQVVASSVRMVMAPDGQLERVVRQQVAYSNSALTTTATTEHANVSFDGNEAVTSQNRSELLKRHISVAGEEHLAVFQSDVEVLLARTQRAFDRLQHLEQIAAGLPPAERPAPFQHGRRTLPGDPVAWGGDETADTAPSRHDGAPQAQAADDNPSGVTGAIDSATEFPTGLAELLTDPNSQDNPGTTLRGGRYFAPSLPELLDLINPRAGQDNCRSCVLALDTTLGGAPMTALPEIPVGSSETLQQHFGARFRHVSLSDIVEEMTVAGHGARGIVLGTDLDPVGHVFNVTNHQGMVIFLDGQSGSADHVGRWQDYMFMRTN